MTFHQVCQLQDLAEQVVRAAETNFTTTGRWKKHITLLVLTDLLKDRGLNPTLTALDQAIESAVKISKLLKKERKETAMTAVRAAQYALIPP